MPLHYRGWCRVIWRIPVGSEASSWSHLTCYPSSSSQAHFFFFFKFGSGPGLTAGEPLCGASAVPAWCIGPAQSCCSADSTAPSPSPVPGRTLQEGEGETQLLRVICAEMNHMTAVWVFFSDGTVGIKRQSQVSHSSIYRLCQNFYNTFHNLPYVCFLLSSKIVSLTCR